MIIDLLHNVKIRLVDFREFSFNAKVSQCNNKKKRFVYTFPFCLFSETIKE